MQDDAECPCHRRPFHVGAINCPIFGEMRRVDQLSRFTAASAATPLQSSVQLGQSFTLDLASLAGLTIRSLRRAPA